MSWKQIQKELAKAQQQKWAAQAQLSSLATGKELQSPSAPPSNSWSWTNVSKTSWVVAGVYAPSMTDTVVHVPSGWPVVIPLDSSETIGIYHSVLRALYNAIPAEWKQHNVDQNVIKYLANSVQGSAALPVVTPIVTRYNDQLESAEQAADWFRRAIELTL